MLVKLIGCLNFADINGTTGYVGGIVGEMRFPGEEISNCGSTGNISAPCNLGGIIGVGRSISINGCYFKEGKIIGTKRADGASMVGGIAGSLLCVQNSPAPTLLSCYNLSSVSASGYGVGRDNSGVLEILGLQFLLFVI